MRRFVLFVSCAALAVVTGCARARVAERPSSIALRQGYGHLANTYVSADGTVSLFGLEPDRGSASVGKAGLSPERVAEVWRLAARVDIGRVGRAEGGRPHEAELVFSFENPPRSLHVPLGQDEDLAPEVRAVVEELRRIRYEARRVH